MSDYDDKQRDIFNSDSDGDATNLSDSPIKDNINDDKLITEEDKEDKDQSVTSQDIRFVLDTISKQAPFDKIQIKQIFYGICSSQTSTKIHHNINSKKSGDGKSYLLKLVADLFPESILLKFINMSDKALYHQQGFEAVKDENTGKYVELDPLLDQLESKIEYIEEQLEEEKSNDKMIIKSYRKQIKEIQKEIKDLKSKSVKIIDLDGKAFIFLDTPNENLFNNLMSLLSQDSRDQLYTFTDKDSSGKRLQARTVILRGSPLIMTTQVVDDTRNYRFAEKNRRFIHVNPDTTEDKIEEAMRQMAIKLGGPSDDFESIISKEHIKKTKKILEKLCKKLEDHNQRFLNLDINDNGIKVPYVSILYSSLPSSDSWSMTVLTRLLNYIAIITKVNMDSRPKLVDTETGVFYPISIYNDLKEALEIMKTASLSIRPYQQDWYNNVFLSAFGELSQEPNYKKSGYGDTIAKENVVGLTTKQLAEKMNQQGNNVSIGSIYENYLRPLIKQGIINYERSILNGKENLYYPVNIGNESDLSNSIFPITEDCRLILNKPFDEKNILEESLGTLSRRRSNGGGVNKYKIIDIDGSELSLDSLLEKYYFNENYYTSCSVVFTKLHNNSIEQYSIVDDEQAKDSERENTEKLNEAEELSQQEAIKKSYECYYCDKFVPTDNRDDYEKHVVLIHDGKLAYPSLLDLKKHNLKPQGKSWES
jgi:hypothetical protein